MTDRVETTSPVSPFTIDWKRLVESFARDVRCDCWLVDPTGRPRTESILLDTPCSRLRSSGRSGQTCIGECWRSGVDLPSSGIHYCAAGLAYLSFPVSAGDRPEGRLICGPFRVDVMDGEVPSHLAELATQHNPRDATLSESLHECYSGMLRHVESELTNKREVLRKHFGLALEKEFFEAIRHVPTEVAAIRLGSGRLWQWLAEAVGSWVPRGTFVEIFTVIDAARVATRMHPTPNSWEDHDSYENLSAELPAPNSPCRGEHRIVWVKHRDRALAAFRVQVPEGAISDDAKKGLQRLADGSGEALQERRERQADEIYKEAARELGKNQDHRERLHEMLDRCRDFLECDDAEIALHTKETDDDQLLKVFARCGKDTNEIRLAELPLLIPADSGITGRVLTEKELVVVTDTSLDVDYTALRKKTAENSSHTADTRYDKYLDRIKSCVTLPLKLGEDVLGVMCFHCGEARHFKLERVHVVELLTQRVAVEAACVLAREQVSYQSRQRREKLESTDKLVALVRHLDPAAARTELLKRLSKDAWEVARAYRTAVCLIDPDYTKVAVVLHHGDWGNKPASISLTEDHSSIITAIKNGDTYVCEDVRAPGAFYLKVDPDETSSVAAIPMYYGTYLVGVLDVEWREIARCERPLVDTLEELAERYAAAIKRFDVDQQMKRLEHELERDLTTDDDYQQILNVMGEMLQAPYGSLLLRRPNTGRYHVIATLVPRDPAADHAYYESRKDPSITGWIIEQNQPLVLNDISDDAERSRYEPRVQWSQRIRDEPDADGEHFAFLGVPIAVGDEVFGVARFTIDPKLRRFDAVDLHVALAAAVRLATRLYQRVEEQRTKAKMHLLTQIPQTTTVADFGKAIFDTIGKGLGEQNHPGEFGAHLRILDKTQEVDGQVEEVMLLAASRKPDWCNPSTWKGPTATHLHGQDAADRVWTTGTRFDDDDVAAEDSACAKLGTPDWFRKSVGAVRVLPILRPDHVGSAPKAAVGTLHIYKRNRRSFSPTEERFLEEVAQIAAVGLESIRERENNRLLLRLEQVAERFLVSIVNAKDLAEAERDLWCASLAVVRNAISSDGQRRVAAWLLLPDASATCLRVHSDNGRPLFVPSMVSAVNKSKSWEFEFSTLRKWLGKEDLRVPSVPTEDPYVVEFLKSRNPELIPYAGKRYVALVGALAEDDLLAVLCFVIDDRSVLSYEQMIKVRDMLRIVADYVTLARRVLDAQLAEPLVLLGAFASNLEHESRSPFANIIGAIDELFRSETTEVDRKDMRKIILEERDKLQQMLSKLTTLLARARHSPVIFDPRAPLTKAVEAANKKAEGRGLPSRCIDFRDATSDEVLVEGVPEYLEIALQFVLNNAIEAVQGQGDACITVELSSRKSGRLRIAIEDSGPGMPPGVLRRALSPFFTTKGGTGLGLPAAYAIVRMHGGHFALEPSSPSGLRVTITLPRSRAEQED